MSAPQVLQRLDKLVGAGRITEEDAALLRAAAETGGLDEALQDIRLRHAKARVSVAVSTGRLGGDEAGVILERLDRGEDPRIVLGVGRKLRPPID
jgi:hypothetical protein